MSLDRYETVGQKKLRCGYTTGSCAAAASSGALKSLLTGQKQNWSLITLPNNEKVSFELVEQLIDSDYAQAAVIKDSGDDFDITDGLRIFSKVSLTKNPGITLKNGVGVGKVTKPGLDVKVGNPAINPVPKTMIISSLEKIAKQYQYDLSKKGLEVEISIPGGEEIAKKTFNPRLGIKGGLSILGTSGIVKPMSIEALIKTIKLELNQKKNEELVFVFGNYGKDFATELNIPEEKILAVSNYIGQILDEAVLLGVKKVLIIGDLGKLIKLAGGIFRTHSSESDARMEILAANLAYLGANQKIIKEILNLKTTKAAIEVIFENKLEEVFDLIVKKIKQKTETRVLENLEIEVILFSKGLGELARTAGATKLEENLNA